MDGWMDRKKMEKIDGWLDGQKNIRKNYGWLDV